jgi:mono/diheme cytochrome c family protein
MLTFTTRRILTTAAFAAALAMASPLAAAAQDDAKVKKGEQVYAAQKCQMCHAIAGKGNKQNPLDGVGKKLSADEIREWITHPKEAATKAKSTKKPPMPAKYDKLSAEDVDALVAYMQSLK